MLRLGAVCELCPGLDALDVAGLLALREAIDARLLALVDGDAGGDLGERDTDKGVIAAPKPGGRRGARWVELKMINGCGPYAYERWIDGGRKRSRYLGKVKE